MKKITIYTGPMCNYCEAAKRLLTRNNATYEEFLKYFLMTNTLVVMMRSEP